MTADLQDLARRIAVTGKWQPRPGSAARDPETGAMYRWLCKFGWRAVNEKAARITVMRKCFPADALERAIAAGPALFDEVTALSLLADLPDAQVARIGTHWRVDVGADRRGFGAVRAEAIARAWVAVHEEEK
jgi:hypothetical protein